MVAGGCTKGVILKNIRVSIGDFRLGPINLSVPQGEILAVIGPNGSGKTTLLRVISGLVRHTGIVEICGQAFSTSLPGRGGLVELVPPEPQADPYAKVSEVLEASGIELWELRNSGIGKRVLSLASKRFGSLSSGEKRLVCLARGLYSRRPVLLVDEPFAHLDIRNQSLLLSELRTRSRRGPLIVALHELHLLPVIADRILALSNGSQKLAIQTSGLAAHANVLSQIYMTPLIVARAGSLTIILPAASEAPGARGGRSEGEAS